jgi:hypothetical protein
MRNLLDKYFPGWSWEMNNKPDLLGAEWIGVYGTLTIIDENMALLGINPPIRKFSATNYVRIKYKRDSLHTPENIIDIGNDASSANSKAFKIAVNRLTHIGDDIYRKQIEEEGAGSYEEVMSKDIDLSKLLSIVTKWNIRPSELLKILDIQSIDEITDYQDSLDRIKKATGRL